MYCYVVWLQYHFVSLIFDSIPIFWLIKPLFWALLFWYWLSFLFAFYWIFCFVKYSIVHWFFGWFDFASQFFLLNTLFSLFLVTGRDEFRDIVHSSLWLPVPLWSISLVRRSVFIVSVVRSTYWWFLSLVSLFLLLGFWLILFFSLLLIPGHGWIINVWSSKCDSSVDCIYF